MEAANSSVSSMEFIGGALCLDFVNTVEYRQAGSGRPVNDFLHSEEEVLLFLLRTKILSGLKNREAFRGEPIAVVIACDLREFLYRGFVKFCADGKISAEFADECNEWLKRLGYRRIVTRDPNGRLRWETRVDPKNPLSFLLPILESSIELLSTGDPDRLRTCPADDCGWFFYDTSKSGRRVWCDMADCGNRAKARRFAQSLRNQQGH